MTQLQMLHSCWLDHYFEQRLACAAPKRWLKYTTGAIILRPDIYNNNTVGIGITNIGITETSE